MKEKSSPGKEGGLRNQDGQMTGQSEEKYRILVEMAGAGIATIDIEGKLTFVNDRLCLLTGYSRAELVGNPFAGFIHKDDLPHLMAAFSSVLGGAKISEMLEFRLIRKDGQGIWIHSNPEPLVIDGKIIGFGAIIYDITDRKKLEEALVKSEVRYRTILDQMQDTYHETDLAGKFTFVSESTTRSFGYPPEELIGKSYKLAVPAEDIKNTLAAFNEVYRTGKPDKGFSHRIRHKDGSITYSEASIDLNRDEQGKVIGFKVINRDITGRRQMEVELRRLASVVQYSSELVNLATIDGQMIFLNNAGARMLGIDPQEVERFNVIQVIPDHLREKVRSDVLFTLAKGDTWEGDLQYQNLKTGLLTDVHAMTFVVKDPSTGAPLYFANVSLDITERKRVEGALRESEDHLRVSLENAPDGVYMNDLEGNFLYGNRRCEEIIGYKREELIGKSFLELNILPENRLARAAEILQDNINGKSTGPDELELISKDGRQVPVEINTSIVQRGRQNIVLAFVRDITERQKSEAALRESEERFRRLSENAIDVIYRYRLKPEAGFDYVSPASVKLTGYLPEEYYADPLMAIKIVHPQDRDLYKQHFKDPQLLGTPLSLRYVCKGGQVTWAEEIDVPVYDINGELVAYEGIVRDITGRMKAERDIQQKALLLDAAYDSIIAYDADGKIIYANETACSLRGYTREEMLAMDMRGLVPVGELPGLERRHKLLAERGELSSEAVHLKKDGSVFLVDTHLRLVEMDGNKLTIAAHRDITARKQMEKLIIDNEARYRSLFEHNPAAVYSLDLQGRFTSINAAAIRMSGYSEEESLKMSMTDVSMPDYADTMSRHFQDSLRGEPQSYDSAIKTKDGKRVDVHITSTPIVINGDIVGVYGIAEDITHRRRLEEERQRVEKLESVGLLAAGIAHDFNNILTSILGNISLAGTAAAPGSELQNSLQQAEKASLRAKDLTQQLLTFSKGGAPVTKLASLTELLNDTVSFALRGSNIKCLFSIPSDLWHAEIDSGQVSQVIQNLVINAQQAMPAGGNMEVRAENMALSGTRSIGGGLPLKAGNYVRIAVTDHGCGIDAEHLEKIFDPFFTTKQKGSGLGLATSFSIARNHGGHLSVESEPGSGSTFYLYLPASTGTVIPRKAKSVASKPSGKARILVMDDEHGVREIAGRMLKHLGYEGIEFAADGVEAVKLYKAAMKSGNAFSVAILDLTIAGGLGGEATIKKLLKIDPEVKGIVSSGYADDPVIARYREYGFRGMVAKPYTLAELGKAVHDVLG